jgi:hypothetical protein
MRSSTSIRDLPDAVRVREQTRLTWSLTGGAMLFLVALQALYLLAYAVCAGAPRWPMHAVALACAALAVALAVWAHGKRSDRPTTEAADGAGDDPVNWLARASLLANGWFALVILSTEIVISVLRRCW